MIQIIDSDSKECAWVVLDYPYGFRLRTQIRYWIETKPGFGQRSVSQTMNPKNGKWNEPKYSTYAPLVVMFEEEEGEENPGYVHCEHLSPYAEKETIQEFVDKWTFVDDYQKEWIKKNLGKDV